MIWYQRLNCCQIRHDLDKIDMNRKINLYQSVLLSNENKE